MLEEGDDRAGRGNEHGAIPDERNFESCTCYLAPLIASGLRAVSKTQRQRDIRRRNQV